MNEETSNTRELNILYAILIILILGFFILIGLNFIFAYIPLNRIEKAAKESQRQIDSIEQTTQKTATDVETSIDAVNRTIMNLETFACSIDSSLPFCPQNRSS